MLAREFTAAMALQLGSCQWRQHDHQQLPLTASCSAG
jgi:hypothetical protein